MVFEGDASRTRRRWMAARAGLARKICGLEETKVMAAAAMAGEGVG